jgi:hypothetical protein
MTPLPLKPHPVPPAVGWLIVRAALQAAIAEMRALLDTLPHGSREQVLWSEAHRAGRVLLGAIEMYCGCERTRPHKY